MDMSRELGCAGERCADGHRNEGREVERNVYVGIDGLSSRLDNDGFFPVTGRLPHHTGAAVVFPRRCNASVPMTVFERADVATQRFVKAPG